METIILASASPRRQEYFRLLRLPFEVIPSPIDEILNERLEPRKAVEELAVQKVSSVRELCRNRERPWIFGADTIVLLNGQIYGKPDDREHARLMLSSLQGQSHEVITAIALFHGETGALDCQSVLSTVSFAPMTGEEIEFYLESDEWQGAAGSYRIQGLASCFITAIQGSFSSIVGLPIREFYVMLKKNNYFSTKLKHPSR